MTDEPRTPVLEPRTPYSGLRSWEPERAADARARALSLLERHIERAAFAPPAAEPARRRSRS
ncbi:MAG: hypothetical protein ACRDLT_02630, partial [Solirubrobacteraceae bacterium]